MILWCDGAHAVDENMRRDAALLDAFDRGAADPPVLRLFRFEPHGITLGHGQEPARELDLERCRARGIGWARRPTGGRAIFHAQEWTYAFAARLDDPTWGGSLDLAYARLSELIAASLRSLGVPCTLGAGRPRAPRAAPRQGTGRGVEAACFASIARHEIVVEGRKLAGSAQRRTARALLQQGSVLLGDGHLALADYLSTGPDARAAARSELARATAHAGRWIDPDTPLERWAQALVGVAEVPIRRGAPLEWVAHRESTSARSAGCG